MALGEVDYGLMGVVGGLVAFVSFINGIMASGVGRFYALSVGESLNNPKQGLSQSRKWFTTAVVIHTVLPIVLVAIGYPIGEWVVCNFLNIPLDRVEACIWVWRFTCLSCFVAMVSVPYQAMYTAHQEIAELTIYSFVTTTLNVLFLYYAINHPRQWLIPYAVWCSFLSVIPSVIISVRAFPKYKECRFRKEYIPGCVSRIWNMLGYCGWISLGAIALLLKGQGATILVNKFFGPRTNASMAIGNTLSAQCTQLATSLGGAFWPAVTTAYGKGDIQLFRALSFRVSKLATCVALIFAIPLSLEVEEVLLIWLKNPPFQADGLCVIAVATFIADKMTAGHCMAINAIGKVAAYQMVISFVLLLTVPVAWFFLRCGYNVYSVGGVVLSTTACATLVRLFFARVIARMSIRKWIIEFVLPVAAVGGLSGMVAWSVRLVWEPSLTRIFTTTGVFLGLYSIGMFLWILDDEEKAYVTRHVAKLIKIRS
ncbi:MAG: hypothetical protein K6G91_09265 [Kiritimatiellae bacterium]|nr:hypothetical protein [Kiritimatiellia bacterium]